MENFEPEDIVNYYYGKEREDPLIPGKRIVFKKGKLISISCNGVEVNQCVINGIIKKLPVDIEEGDLFNLPEGDIAIIASNPPKE